MCDYSLEGYRSRKAEVGDVLTTTLLGHGFMRAEDVAHWESHKDTLGGSAICVTCLFEDGIVLNIKNHRFTGVDQQVTYKNLKLGRGEYNDAVVFKDGRVVCLAQPEMRNVTAEVISIPSQMPKPSMDERLGVDKINARLTQGEEPAASPEPAGIVRRVLDAVTGR